MAVKRQDEPELVTFVEEPKTGKISMPGVEADYVEEAEPQDWYSYLRVNLKDLEDGDEYTGKPLLTNVETVTFDNDGEEQLKHRCRLILIDDEMEEYLQININLKKNDIIQENVHKQSSLFALIGSLRECGGDKTFFKKNNRIKKVNLQEWMDYIDTVPSMTIRVFEKAGSTFTYNSFKVIEVQTE